MTVFALFALAAIPYALLRLAVIPESVAAVFFVVDLFIVAGLVRALIIYVKDKYGVPL